MLPDDVVTLTGSRGAARRRSTISCRRRQLDQQHLMDQRVRRAARPDGMCQRAVFREGAQTPCAEPRVPLPPGFPVSRTAARMASARARASSGLTNVVEACSLRVSKCAQGLTGFLAPVTDVRHPTRSPMRGLHAVAPICGGRRRSRSLKRYSAPSAPIADARGTREGEPRAVSQRCDAVSPRTASRRLPATVLPPHDASPSMWA